MTKRVAIVTGVSRLKGIGRAICIALAKQGHDIFFTYYQVYDEQMEWGADENAVEAITAELKNIGVSCASLEIDLTSDRAADTVMNKAISTLGPVSILVNNATYSTASQILTIETSNLDQHYAVNIKANVLLTQAFIKNFKTGSHGRIINMSSGQALSPMHHEIAYAMTKSAIDTLTVTLSSTLAAKGITINSVNPGPTDTGWMTDDLEKVLKSASPPGRIGRPEDTARLIAFLVSEDAAWITGQVIHSEGGFDRYKNWG